MYLSKKFKRYNTWTFFFPMNFWIFSLVCLVMVIEIPDYVYSYSRGTFHSFNLTSIVNISTS